MKQIPINLCQGISCTIRHNPGVMSPSNVITPPQSRQIRSDGVYGCLTAHYHKVSPRNIFEGFKEQAFMVIQDG